MSYHRESADMQQTYPWTWHVMPMLIAAAALSALFTPQGSEPVEATAAQPMGIEALSRTMLLVPSPQPGEGEPELVAANLPQSY